LIWRASKTILIQAILKSQRKKTKNWTIEMDRVSTKGEIS